MEETFLVSASKEGSQARLGTRPLPSHTCLSVVGLRMMWSAIVPTTPNALDTVSLLQLQIDTRHLEMCIARS